MGLMLKNTKLFEAVANNKIEDICGLIDSGADVDSEFTIKDLIDHNIIGARGVIAIHADYCFWTAVARTESQPGPSIQSKLSALQLAVMYGWKEVIITLIKKGADPNKAIAIRNTTILQLMYANAGSFGNASVRFDNEIIKLLLEYGADPNDVDVHGRTALMYSIITPGCSCVAKYIDGIELLLINGANPKIKDLFGSALWHKTRNQTYLVNSQRVIKLILNHDATPEDTDYEFNLELKQHMNNNVKLIRAIKRKQKIQIERFLKQGISPNIRDKDGLSALEIAIDDYGIIELLLSYYANPNIRSWTYGLTPLFQVVVNNNVNIAKLLLEHGANPNVLNASKLSPLYYSVTSNNTQMTELLLSHNANPDIASQISMPISFLPGMYTKENKEQLIETMLEIVESMVSFLNQEGISLKNVIFYKAAIIAEENGQKAVGKRIANYVISNDPIPQMNGLNLQDN